MIISLPYNLNHKIMLAETGIFLTKLCMNQETDLSVNQDDPHAEPQNQFSLSLPRYIFCYPLWLMMVRNYWINILNET